MLEENLAPRASPLETWTLCSPASEKNTLEGEFGVFEVTRILAHRRLRSGRGRARGNTSWIELSGWSFFAQPSISTSIHPGQWLATRSPTIKLHSVTVYLDLCLCDCELRDCR